MDQDISNNKNTKIDIVTYCSGYPFEVFDRFIGSLNDTGFSGNIHIIINDFDIPVINKIKNKYKNVFPVKDNLAKNTHINCHRFFCIKHLLENKEFDCDYFLICDSRDVLFQKNIETYPYDPNIDIYGFLEGIKIINEPVYNVKWVKMVEQIVKEPVYDEICNNNIICCGTTIGKIDPIKKYVNKMCKIIKDNNITLNLDQGIHNYLLYLNKLELNIKLLSNEDNFINTVGNDLHKINEDSLIVNKNDDVSYVVHQYDRFSKENREKISVKYNYKI